MQPAGLDGGLANFLQKEDVALQRARELDRQWAEEAARACKLADSSWHAEAFDALYKVRKKIKKIAEKKMKNKINWRIVRGMLRLLMRCTR